MTPALPLSSDSGATLALNSPLTFNELRQLEFYYGDSQFSIVGSSNKISLNGANGEAYVIDQYEGMKGIIEIKRTTDSPSTKSVLSDIKLPNMILSQIPPFEAGRYGSETIKFKRKVTFADLVGGLLRITVQPSASGSSPVVLTTREGSSYLYLDDGTNSIEVATIERFDGERSDVTIVFTSQAASAGYRIIDIKFRVYQFEIFSDEQCTQRPEVGQEYTSLYIQVNKEVNINEGAEYGSQSSQFTYLQVYTPTTEDPEEGYDIFLYIDFQNSNGSNNYQKGVYKADCYTALLINEQPTVSFGQVVYI